jgi:hypothetical protein
LLQSFQTEQNLKQKRPENTTPARTKQQATDANNHQKGFHRKDDIHIGEGLK